MKKVKENTGKLDTFVRIEHENDYSITYNFDVKNLNHKSKGASIRLGDIQINDDGNGVQLLIDNVAAARLDYCVLEELLIAMELYNHYNENFTGRVKLVTEASEVLK